MNARMKQSIIIISWRFWNGEHQSGFDLALSEPLCQVRLKCSGQDCSWDNWEADHKLPWSHDGKTTVEKGQVACFGVQRFKGRDYTASRLMRYFNLLPDTRPFSLPRRRSGKNALNRFRRRGASA
jgi:hypothetical protein